MLGLTKSQVYLQYYYHYLAKVAQRPAVKRPLDVTNLAFLTCVAAFGTLNFLTLHWQPISALVSMGVTYRGQVIAAVVLSLTRCSKIITLPLLINWLSDEIRL